MKKLHERRCMVAQLLVLHVVVLVFFVSSAHGAVGYVDSFGEAASMLADAVVEHVRPQAGAVATVVDGDVYISLGRDDRIRPGQGLEVVRLGRELINPLTGEPIGTVEEPVGLLEVTTVRESFSIGRMVAGSGPAEEGDLVYTLDEGLSIAVVPFALLTGRSLSHGTIFAERLGALLAAEPALKLVEREQLNTALAELDFGLSGLVDSATARELGSFLGVNVLVVGTMAESGSEVLITMRMLEVQTGLVLLARTIDVVGESLSGAAIERSPGVATTSASPGAWAPAGPLDRPVPQPLGNWGELGGGDDVFDIVFRQQLAERAHRIAVGNLQGRGQNLASFNFSSGEFHIYRLTEAYEKLWSTILTEQFGLFGNIVYLSNESGDDRAVVATGDAVVYWDGSRWRQTRTTYSLGEWVDLRAGGDVTRYGAVPSNVAGIEVYRWDGTARYVKDLTPIREHPEAWFLPPLIAKPFPSGEYAVSIAFPTRFRLLDDVGEIQWESADLAAVTAGVAFDIDGDGIEELVLAQFVDESGRPNPALLDRIASGESPSADELRARLLVVAWSHDLLQPKIVARSPVLQGERVWDMTFADVTMDGTPTLVVLTGPPRASETEPSSIYHVQIHL